MYSIWRPFECRPVLSFLRVLVCFDIYYVFVRVRDREHEWQRGTKREREFENWRKCYSIVYSSRTLTMNERVRERASKSWKRIEKEKNSHKISQIIYPYILMSSFQISFNRIYGNGNRKFFSSHFFRHKNFRFYENENFFFLIEVSFL